MKHDSMVTLVKLRLPKKNSNNWWLFVIIFGMISFFLLFAAAQVYVCRQDHPGMGIMNCLKGNRR